jgi:hypothetical protein
MPYSSNLLGLCRDNTAALEQLLPKMQIRGTLPGHSRRAARLEVINHWGPKARLSESRPSKTNPCRHSRSRPATSIPHADACGVVLGNDVIGCRAGRWCLAHAWPQSGESGSNLVESGSCCPKATETNSMIVAALSVSKKRTHPVSGWAHFMLFAPYAAQSRRMRSSSVSLGL